jgi:hypothetical protein
MPGPASILVIAKKKAAGPGGFFDPMTEHAGMAMGPMMFEMSSESEEEDTEDEPSEEKASMVPDMSKMDFRQAASKLREIAEQLDASSSKHAAQAKTIKEVIGDEPTEEVEPEPVKAAPPKKGPPAFLKPKPMKY